MAFEPEDLHTPSLELLSVEHVDALVKIANHPRISRTSGVVPGCDEAVIVNWAAENRQQHPTEVTFAIRKAHRIAGCCILKKMDAVHHTAELSYWLGVDFWGQGIARMAAALLRDRAFEHYGVQSLSAHYLKNNNPVSGHILMHIGFVANSSRDDVPVQGRFLHLAPDVWTFCQLTRGRWLNIRDKK